MLKFWTAPYRYAGPHRLDITVKGNDPIGRFFAPSWEMVMEHKKTNNSDEYIAKYHKMMQGSYLHHRNIWDELLSQENAVLVCFCGSNQFCHRFLLAEYLQQLGAKYMGEIQNEQQSTEVAPNVINSFRGKYRFLSNTYPCKIEHNGITFDSSEHLFQAYKYGPDDMIFVPEIVYGKKVLVKVNARRHIASLPRWQDAKKLGRKAPLRPEWDAVESIETMDLALELKFKPHSWFANALLDTDPAILIEGNTWHDNKWGNCICIECENIEGRNLLGMALMKRRNQLK